MKRILIALIFIQVWELSAVAQQNSKNLQKEAITDSRSDHLREGTCLATINLYNPTRIGSPAIVKVPVGDIATPGIINWRDVSLVYNGNIIPFSIQEGMAHWKSALIAPVEKPRAEDLLIFTISIPSGQWAKVTIVSGRSKRHPALTRKGNKMIISYPGMKTVIDKRTGLLTMLDASGTSILDSAMSLQFFEVGKGVVIHKGAMGASGGPHHPSVVLQKGKNLKPPKVRLLSWSSTAAFTEINFVIQPVARLKIGLTYRIYSNGQVEILSDERPWQGTSTWLHIGLQYRLPLAGEQELLPGFQTYFPFYGYKDYAAAVKSTGSLYHGTEMMTFELGEQSINGRFWHRRLAIYPADEAARKDDLLSHLNNGLVVKIWPVYSQPFSKKVGVVYADTMKDIGNLVVGNLRNAGIRAASGWQKDSGNGTNILLKLTGSHSAPGISGDGFRIQPLRTKAGIEVVAATTFGLYRGAALLSKSRMSGDSMRVPLVSQNPVVDLRAGGFGGGVFEVDFPFGNDSDWEHTFSNMVAGGMNVITDQGMWSDWKMPVYFKYMPALQSNASGEYDPVTGTTFSQTANYRKESLKLLKFLHDRGVKVWLWVPIGAVPTTFAERFSKAMMPGNKKTPRFLSPEYQQYLRAYFKEILEVYPVDGLILIRDDNGGIDTTSAFKKYVAESQTKNPVWEQFLAVYKLLRSMGFKKNIAVYPYGDIYEPGLDSLLPKNLMIVGHGSGLGVLTRNFNTLGAMGDTWLDNLYAGFRVPASGRMKRLLSDRGSYWIGGAYKGAELPWQTIGYFGWQPSASVNTFRYDAGESMFGKKNALTYTVFSNAYEHLWEIMELWLLPTTWVRVSDSERMKISEEGRRWLVAYYQQLNKLEDEALPGTHKDWFAQVGLYGSYFNYHLRRLELFNKMESIAVANKDAVQTGKRLPEPLRNKLLAMNNEIYALAYGYDQHTALVPGKMMASLRANKMTLPFKEWVFGYGWLDNMLSVKQFAGNMRILPVKLTRGKPFTLRIELQNNGCIPWISGIGLTITLHGDTAGFGLPAAWNYDGSPMVFGDRRIITLHGVAPAQPGITKIKMNFVSPFRSKYVFASQTVELEVQ